jgi:signal peptidase I
MEPRPNRGLRGRDTALVLIAAVAASLFLRAFVVGAYLIPSRSMEPSLKPGDYLLVDKLLYGPGVGALRLPSLCAVKRGDVLLFRVGPGVAGMAEEATFVKRCVAVPGDSLAVVNGVVWVNGVRAGLPQISSLPSSLEGKTYHWMIPRKGEVIRLDPSSVSFWHSLVAREGHRVEITPRGAVKVDGEPATEYRIQMNHYFVAGDNTADSYDSRYWGLIGDDAVIGKAFLIYWSFDQARVRGSLQGRLSSVRWGRIGSLVR